MKKKETFQEIIKRESLHCRSKPYEYYEVKGAEFSRKLAAYCPELRIEFLELWLGLLKKVKYRI